MDDYVSDHIPPPTAEQRLMSESCRSCGDPMEWRGKCHSCRIEEIKWAIEVTEQKIDTLRIQREEILKQVEANDKRIAKINGIVETLEEMLAKRTRPTE